MVKFVAAKMIVNRCVKHFCVSQPKLTTVIIGERGGGGPPFPPHRRWGKGTQQGFVQEIIENITCE